MKRYVAQRQAPRSCDYYEPEFISTTTVLEYEAEPIPTGILDKHGNDICSVEQMDPIGFISLQERE